MGFVQSFDNLMKMVKETYDFYDAEMLVLAWETKPEIVKRLLPPPLSASDRPIVVAFLANYPRTNFSAPYLEGALLLKTAYNGINGYYCLAMPVTNDLGMAGGREQFRQRGRALGRGGGHGRQPERPAGGGVLPGQGPRQPDRAARALGGLSASSARGLDSLVRQAGAPRRSVPVRGYRPGCALPRASVPARGPRSGPGGPSCAEARA